MHQPEQLEAESTPIKSAPGEVRARIRAFIADAFLVDEFRDDESFLASGIIDSLGMMQIVSFLERQYAMTIVDDELVPENLDSVNRIVTFVHRKRREVAPWPACEGAT